jgi:long-chain fatty acid transport protein
MKIRTFVHAAVLPLVFLPGMALATAGYFSLGYGVKSSGMGGVGIALPQDGLAAATNPAGTAFVGDRVDLGLTWFMPNRSAEITGVNENFLPGANGEYSGNDKRNFFIPEIGYVKQFSPQLSGGVAVYGNGGMNTDYGSNPFAAWGANGNAGVDLSQLFISPSLAYKITPDHSIGIAVNIAYQRFKAYGLPPAFVNPFFSESPSNMTDNGYDSAWGWGGRIGYTGKITPELTIGATYATKTYMGKFDKYQGLYAEQGDFDVPANFGVGVSWKAMPALTLAADYMRIQYSGVKSIANQMPVSDPNIQMALMTNKFGSSNGPGFGWEDVNVFKLGAAYETGAWTLRGGYAYASQAIPESQTFLNILAPGIVQHHLTLGATWATSKTGELSFNYVHAFENTVNGSGSIPPALAAAPGAEANITMHQNSFGVAYGWKF